MGIEPSHLTMKEEASWFLLSKASHALEWTTLSLNEKGKVKKNLIIIIIILSDCLLVGSCEGHIYSSGVTDGGVRLGRAGQGSERNKTWAGDSSHQKNNTRGVGLFFLSFLFLSSQGHW